MPVTGRIAVNETFCKGCELCVHACPRGALQLTTARINSRGYHPVELLSTDCTGCGTCALMCPEAAIMVFRSSVRKPVAELAAA